MTARKTFYLNTTTKQQTPATTNTDKTRAQWHRVAMEWRRNGDDVAIIDAATGEIILTWEH